jgi:hypothetical protein
MLLTLMTLAYIQVGGGEETRSQRIRIVSFLVLPSFAYTLVYDIDRCVMFLLWILILYTDFL